MHREYRCQYSDGVRATRGAMHATNDEETMEHPVSRGRAARRVIENVELSDRTAGERVIEVVRTRLAYGSHRVVIMSPDNALPPEIVEHAFDALRFSRLVCAPGTDGNIALLGMTQSHDAILTAIPWGTDAALDALLREARASSLPMMILPSATNGRAG